MLAIVCGIGLASSGAASEPLVQWRDGRLERAELVRFAPDHPRMRIGGEERTVPAADIVSWGRLREPPRGPALLLRGGSLIVVEEWRVTPDRLHGQSFWFREFAVEKRLVRAAILGWSTDAMAHDRELRTWLASTSSPPPPTARDQLLLESGDTVSGGVVGWDEAVGDEPKRLRVKLARGETRLAADAIRAILWSPGSGAESPPRKDAVPKADGINAAKPDGVTGVKPSGVTDVKPDGVTGVKPDSVTGVKRDGAENRGMSWILGLRDGSLLWCERMEAGDGRTMADGAVAGGRSWVLRLRDGVELICDAAVLGEELVFVQPLAPGGRYLSDMETSGFKHVPLFGQPWGFERDANASGGALRCGGRRYPKGLGMHATARLAFTLAEPFQRFRASLGIDDAAVRRGPSGVGTGNRGSVIFRVYVDRGAGKWEPAFASGVVRGGDRPVPLDLDITGARGLALIVDAADHGDQGDLANWLDARLE
jgi:hypothetical protein